MALTGTSSDVAIVGIGASAGGLGASTEILRCLGNEPGFAVVVVHHLDPTHQSQLVEIFSRATGMRVQVASDGLPIEQNCVYITPPHADLLCDNDVLRLVPRGEGGARHLPIDRFFESIAEALSARAAGVVLSGGGSDGSLGVRAIKREGGVTFAQDASAEYRSMPDSAIATGCVDFVLPPNRIAEELLRMGMQTRLAGPVVSAPDEESDFLRILAALRKVSGVDFANYKRSTLRRRVRRRMFLHRAAHWREYAELVERDPAEAGALVEEVLIHVTGFFRDPDVFEALKLQVFPKLLEKRTRTDPIRVWIPGSSTGEEVYSLAISLLEFLAQANASDVPIRLFGTDVSDQAIDAARAARYTQDIASEVSAGQLQRFFARAGSGYQIRREVRELCIFARHDATRDPPFSGIDLISCRNLMIYLGAALQDRVLPLLHYALKDRGFLLLGTSETTRSFGGFSCVDARHKIYARTLGAPRLVLGFNLPQVPGLHFQEGQAVARMSSVLDVQREADRLVLAEFGPPGVVVSEDLSIVQFRGKTGLFLEPAPGAASFDLLRMARDELRIPLRQAIDEARAKRTRARKAGVHLLLEPGPRIVDVEVVPFSVAATEQRFFVVLFEDVTPPLAAAVAPGPSAASERESSAESQLRQELASTKEYLHSILEQSEANNEELRAANEEITSSNEELRSTNEELQMAKEELQATNVETLIINQEMVLRHAEVTRLNDDLTNVLTSVDFPILLLGRDLCIRRFTPSAARVLQLVEADVGRPVGDFDRTLLLPMAKTAAEVIEHLRPVEAEYQDQSGRWYLSVARPYVTADSRIDGAVFTVRDIDDVKRAAARVAEAREYAESIVESVRECLLVLDRDSRVCSANRAFYRTFGGGRNEVEGRLFHELGRGEWNIPALRTRLEQLVEGDSFEAFRLVRELPGGGTHTFELNACRISGTPLVLLSVEDSTERERAREALARSETELRDVLTHAAEAVLMTDLTGVIVFANQAAAQLFGYETNRLLGLGVDALVPERWRQRHAGHRATYSAAASPRPMGRDLKLLGLRKDGTEFPIEVLLNPMVRGPLVACFVTDVTKRREADEKIQRYQEKLQQMAFDAALTEEHERRRIAVDLHDRIGQSLALAQIKLDSVHETLACDSRRAVDEALELVKQSISDARSLTFELSPPILYDLGLTAALSWLVEDFEKRYGIKIELDSDVGSVPLGDATAALVFRAVRELLLNVFKHAKTPTAKLSLQRDHDTLHIQVEDQGVGFHVDSANGRSAGDSGFGLFSVREQIARLGGVVDVQSRVAEGTQITLRVPLGTTNERAPESR